jgi:Glutamine amidotransferase domain
MCGIAGISLNPQDKKLNVAVATAELLRGIASRGGDATGAAWYDHETDSVKLTKVAVQVNRFLEARESILPETTPVMILHTRFATVGDKSNRLNNHPIQYSNIIGVHNGCLWGHSEMFKNLGLKPHAEVDSEAIMALLSTTKEPAGRMAEIEGDAALAWIDLYEPEVLHLARVVDRPLNVGQTKEGSLIFSSTMESVRAAAKKAGVELEFELEVPEAKYLKVVGGVIAEYLDIPGVQVRAGWAQKYAYTSGTKGASKPAPKGTTPAKAAAATALAFSDKTEPVYMALAKMTTAELVKLVQEGSVAALDRLEYRGLNGQGFYKRFIPDETVQRMAKASSDWWALDQIQVRGLDKKPERKYPDPSTLVLSELVTAAAGGSNIARVELEKRGYNVVGEYVGDYQKLDDATLIDMSRELKDQRAIDQLAERGLNMFGEVIPVGFRQEVTVS